MRRALVIGLLLAALALPSSAVADPPPTFPDACSTALDSTSCERLDYLAAETASLDTDLNYTWVGIAILAGIVTFGVCVRPHWDRLFNWWGNPT